MRRFIFFIFLAAMISMADSQEVLKPGDTRTYTAQYTVKDTDICDNIVNNAIVNATGPCSSFAEDNDTESVSPSHPAIRFEKTADRSGEAVNVGDIITYHYIVENIGGVNLTNVSIKDDMVPSVYLIFGDDSDSWLNRSEIWTYEGTYEVKENDLCSKIVNWANLTAQDLCNRSISKEAYAEVETTCNEWICTCCDSGTNWDGIDIGNQKALGLHNSEAKNRVNIIADQKGGRDCRAKNGAKIITNQREEN